jgi:glyoxylase-like metal-dependent hydrolase (beta-lactamase superfamily II)
VAALRAHNRFAAARAPREVVDGIWLLGSHRVNFYAVVEGRSVTLVDAGFYGHLRYLNDWLSATGRSVANIDAIVITHGHADHLGFAGDFDRRGVPVFVHERDVAISRTTKVRCPPIRCSPNLRCPALGPSAPTSGSTWPGGFARFMYLGTRPATALCTTRASM